MNVAIIVAGGTGERTGLGAGKQLALIAGRPVLYHTVVAFDACAAIDRIVVVAHPDRVDEYRVAAIDTVGSGKVAAVVAGGDTRQASVTAGLKAVPISADVICVHDGARPLITPDVIEAALRMLEATPELAGVVVGHPAYDTLKSVDAGAGITGTLDRSRVWVAQTPQVFRAHALRTAYAAAAAEGYVGTDDASLVERMGGALVMFAGPRDNVKITVPEDVLLVEQILRARGEGTSDG